jgi:anaerobic ribonucleoside-triphosphate reductase activating protein
MMPNKRSLSSGIPIFEKNMNNLKANNHLFLRIAGIVKESVVDGPGLRYVIFTQGCPHACIGCHNPETHDFNGGYEIAIDEILQSISKIKLLSGITLSGGEPFAQAAACAKLAELTKKRGLSVVTYSGYYYAELLDMAKTNSSAAALLAATDILIDGPYDQTKRDLNLPFRGSSNQEIYFLSK